MCGNAAKKKNKQRKEKQRASTYVAMAVQGRWRRQSRAAVPPLPSHHREQQHSKRPLASPSRSYSRDSISSSNENIQHQHQHQLPFFSIFPIFHFSVAAAASAAAVLMLLPRSAYARHSAGTPRHARLRRRRRRHCCCCSCCCCSCCCCYRSMVELKRLTSCHAVAIYEQDYESESFRDDASILHDTKRARACNEAPGRGRRPGTIQRRSSALPLDPLYSQRLGYRAQQAARCMEA